MDNKHSNDNSKRANDNAKALLGRFLIECETVRRQSGLSYAELAKRMGVSRAYISKLVGGGQNPTLSTLVKLSEALDSTISLSLNQQKVISRVTIRKLYE